MKKLSIINFDEGAANSAELRKAMTLVEVLISIALLGIVFSAILPQFRAMFNGWDGKQASAEILQNSRILLDHLNNNLSKAVRVTTVSPATQVNGFIEFKDTADVTQRYDVSSSSNYVEFGAVGSLSDLAGPVSQLQFTCYDACDVATTDVTKIRYVQASTTFTSSAALGQSRTFNDKIYIRANYQDDDVRWDINKASLSWFEYDNRDGWTPALCQIDSTHYLCAYNGYGNGGWAVVLTVNTSNWNVSEQTPYEFESGTGVSPALTQIDSTHYLCAYEGPFGTGWAVVLEVNLSAWTVSAKTPFEFDSTNGHDCALIKIDSSHYLCAYRGANGNQNRGLAVVLELNQITWGISEKTTLQFESSKCYQPVLAQIDNNHYFCVYRGSSSDGWSAVLEINLSNWNITKKSSYEFDASNGQWPAVVKIDSSHYLCTYAGASTNGLAVVLTVNNSTWAIGKMTPFIFDTVYCAHPTLIWMTGNHYVCAYGANGSDGTAISLTVRTDNWTISKDSSYVFDSVKGLEPFLAMMDDVYCIFAYRGPSDDGWCGVLRVGVPILP